MLDTQRRWSVAVATNHDGGSHHQRLGNTGLTNQRGQEAYISIIIVLLIMKRTMMIIIIIIAATFNEDSMPGPPLSVLPISLYLLFMPTQASKCYFSVYQVKYIGARKAREFTNINVCCK